MHLSRLLTLVLPALLASASGAEARARAPHAGAIPFAAPNLAAPNLTAPSLTAPNLFDRDPFATGATDGLFAAGVGAQSGQLVITEIMKDPNHVSDARGEWFEVWNAMPWRVNLEGWSIADESGANHVISTGGAGLRIRPGGFLVIGNNSDPALNGGIQVDYVWSSFSLANGADQILLKKPDGSLVDRVAYDDGVLWPDLAGRSISLRPGAWDVLANDDPANWCHATSAISGTNPDRGTPGGDNDPCS